jgi:GH15 family glucan-1,4-alpha-glucosidase
MPFGKIKSLKAVELSVDTRVDRHTLSSKAGAMGSAINPPLETYGFIGNMHSAALVGLDGSMDWLCLPGFDSDACFAALLGTPENGRWRITPEGEPARITRRYREGTPILETRFETSAGAVTLIDFMPLPERRDQVDVMRLVRGDRGCVDMVSDMVFRLGYGRIIPWLRRRSYGLSAIAGPDGLQVRTPVALRSKDMTTHGRFTVRAGDRVPFVLTWFPSHRAEPGAKDPEEALARTEDWWRDWSTRCVPASRWHTAVQRSLITLKAMTYQPTGAIVAAPTTSLPEDIGGERNWDYRYCWIRDATLTLYALLSSSYVEEARAWREWLQRAAAGDPQDLQIMYGIAGERWLGERELPWLPGYGGSRPVRVGNAAHRQLQLDVFGELMDVFHVARRHHVETHEESWGLQRVLIDYLEEHWTEPDSGIWEIRGPPRQFTYSKVMSWVAVDRAVKAVECHGLDGPVDRWRALRQTMRDDICRNGFNQRRNSFVQTYGGDSVDASLLGMAQVGFLAPDDPRFVGTVRAIEQDLMENGLLLRYRNHDGVDGLPGREGVFLACSFWLVDAYALMGRLDEANELFDRLLTLRNDLGLLSEEYDPRHKRLVGNYPQAFSHIALAISAHNLASANPPAKDRAEGKAGDKQTPMAPDAQTDPRTGAGV